MVDIMLVRHLRGTERNGFPVVIGTSQYLMVNGIQGFGAEGFSAV